MLALDGRYAPTVLHSRAQLGLNLPRETNARAWYRLVLIQEGRMDLITAAESTSAWPGDVVFWPPGLAIRWQHHHQARATHISFTVLACPLKSGRKQQRSMVRDRGLADRFQPPPQRIWNCTPPLIFPRELSAQTGDIIKLIADNWWHGDLQHFEANHRLAYLLSRMVHFYHAPPESRVVGADDHPISRVLRVVHAHYPVLQQAGDIARRLGLSISRMNVSFRTASGETPMAYLRRYRLMEAARLLLLHQEAGIDGIAAMVGYRNGKALHKAWMKQYDQPPRLWRRAQLTL